MRGPPIQLPGDTHQPLQRKLCSAAHTGRKLVLVDIEVDRRVVGDIQSVEPIADYHFVGAKAVATVAWAYPLEVLWHLESQERHLVSQK